MVSPYGYGPSQISLITVSCLVFGLIGVAISSSIVDKNKKYKLVNCIYALFSAIWMTTICFTIKHKDHFWLFSSSLALYGFFSIPMGPLSMAFLSIESYPVEKTFVNGVITICVHIYTAVFSIIVETILIEHPENPIGIFYFSASACLIGAICILAVKPKNKN
mmetsp:Transcript_10749/g.14839  ORF Transcript_10749/g.14839 Transcript_10749/m.14839 type:complete len:163 (+) Transcript_10749:261-749(+)